MSFRKDINGLRALAVLPVIFFHAGLGSFEGGYLGVDVFFVISGYLITANILSEKKQESFSLLSFYDRRARRILPPLILTMLIVLFFSFMFMLPYDLKNLGQSLVATSYGANNILLYLTSGYWSAAAEYKPLYHTWSLGVEEQYYVIIPMIFIVLFRYNWLLVACIVSLILISFIASSLIDSKEFNFLMILPRFWELGTGSLLAIYMRNRVQPKSEALSALGLGLIFTSYVTPNLFSTNQAIVNLLPVLGAALVILFTNVDGNVYRLLSQRFFFIIGLSSYSIYLFHQPILSFLRLYSEGEVGVVKQLIFSLLAIPLGYFSWKYFESIFRRKEIISNKLFYSLLLFFISFLTVAGLILHKTYGLQNYGIYTKYSYGVNPQAYADKPYSMAKNEFSSSSKKILIIGNSFARDFYNALNENDAFNGYEVIYLYDYYDDVNLSRRLLASADLTFYVSSSGMGGEINYSLINKVAIERKNELDEHSNGNYYYVGTKNFGSNNNFIRHHDWEKTKNYMVEINKSNLCADQIEKKIFDDKYISLLDLLRDGDKIRLFTNDHKFISFDTEHITKDGAVFLGKKFLQSTELKKIIF